MKKIIAIFLMFVLVATSVSAVTINQKNENVEADECIECNEYEEVDEENCECNFVDGYPVANFPPKTEEQLEKMIDDPQPTRSFDDLPSQFSWLSYNGDWSTPAKDQGSCGSCWDFSAIGGVEASINIASGQPGLDIDLSEQYVLSCLSAAGSCSGGWMSEALDYIQSDDPGNVGNGINGCPIESCMPYTATDYVPCDDKCNDWDEYTSPYPEPDDKLWQIKSWGVTSISEDDPNGWDLIKTWLIDHGPVITDINADGIGSMPNDPNYVIEHDYPGITNHGVLICGYVDDPDIMNGGYWIIKNSWGQGYGYNGFFNIAYGCNSLGTRDLSWVETTDWNIDEDDDELPDIDMAVFANFDYLTDGGNKYPHVGEEIEFTDTSDGDVALYEWDFDGDGNIDSTNKHPTWTFNQVGEYEVTLTVSGTFGLTSTRTRTIEVKNNWPPVVDGIPAEKIGNELTYHFDARYCYDPDGTIDSYLWDFDDGTTSSDSYLNHEFSEADKIYEVTLTLTDNEGATSTGNCIVKIDQTVPPVTTIQHGIGNTGSDWYSEMQRISFTATDWTSVIDTFYRVNGGAWESYETGDILLINNEGEHTIEAYSVDYYGNEETPVSETFGIDKTAPTLESSISGNFQGEQYIGPVTVTLTGDDDTSGIDKIIYKMGGMSSWVDYNGPFEVTESCILSCVAVDNAGNTYEEDVNIAIEGPPTIPSISGPSRGTPGEEVEFVFKATDYSPSLEDNIYLYIEWGDGEVEDWIGPFDSGEEVVRGHVFSEEKTYTVRAKAKDKLGAESDWGEYHVTMPKAKSMDFPLLQRFFSNFPVLQEILQLIANW